MRVIRWWRQDTRLVRENGCIQIGLQKRGGVTYPRTDFTDFVKSLDQENADLTVEFSVGTTVQFPVWNGYDKMREHITCVE